MIRLLFFIAAGLLSVGFTLAQGVNGVVYGRDPSGAQYSLPGAVLFWEGTRSGTITDENGHYSIGHPPDARVLICQFVGYISDSVVYDGQTTIDFTLVQLQELNTVNVQGNVGATTISMIQPQHVQILNEKELCKAACCNLSESFETNASVDAAFADAITGTRQIRMLGLEGKYTQMLFDNIPAVRGLASTYGLTYVPGPWIKNIYISKGTGSVVSGYESISGQINVAMKSPENAEKFHLNVYAGSSGRTEMNLVFNPAHDHEDHEQRLHLKPVFLAHGAWSGYRTDMNRDGFLDNPLFTNLILRNEWQLQTQKGVSGQFVLGYLHLKNSSGQLDYDPADEVRSTLWGVDLVTNRYEFSSKVGYVFKNKSWKSFGSQINVNWHDQEGKYGFRNYHGNQLSMRANLLFASRILSEKNLFTVGVSQTLDDFQEGITFDEFPPISMSSLQTSRKEITSGVFGEYTFNSTGDFTLVLGMRGDVHSVYGLFFTPRIHARYSLNANNSLKIVAGKGYRSPNILMDHVGVLAGNREITIRNNQSTGILGLDMEEAWNTGFIWVKKFKLNHREATCAVDIYQTWFEKQVVLDLETPTRAVFYNLDGKSYSTSVQAELSFTPVRRFDVRMAYRWLDTKTNYDSGLLIRPLVNQHRAFFNLAFATKETSSGSHWRFDVTTQWISRKRIPYTGDGQHEHHAAGDVIQSSTYSPDYFQVNAQLTYAFKKDLEVYLGGENLTNFMVHDAIIAADRPDSEQFDGSMVWGPVFGRMGYIGLRWILR